MPHPHLAVETSPAGYRAGADLTITDAERGAMAASPAS